MNGPLKILPMAAHDQTVYGFSGADIDRCYRERACSFTGRRGTWIWGATVHGKPIAIRVDEGSRPVLVHNVSDKPPFDESVEVP